MGATMRVLVLDDQPDKGLLRVLRTMGAIPLVARTEEEAIVIINAGIDAAIVDMQLDPNWRYGGIAVIRYLREHLGLSVPVILFTGHLDQSAWAECEELNALYVVKPGPTIASLVDYLRENLPAAARTSSGVRASASTDSKDCIAVACEVWQERYDLSAMEAVVLEAAARGGNRTTIAREIKLSPETVKTHTRKLIAKTGDESLVGAGARLVREALVTSSMHQEMGAQALPRAGDAPDDDGVQMTLGVHAQRFDHRTFEQTSTRIDLAREEAYAKAIAAASGNLTKAGQLLGVSRQAVQNFIARQRR